MQWWKGMFKIQSILCASFIFKKKHNSEVFFVKSQDDMRKSISGFVIIHPMIIKDQKYRKLNGHTVLTHCWRIRTANGLCGFIPQSSDLCVFVEEEWIRHDRETPKLIFLSLINQQLLFIFIQSMQPSQSTCRSWSSTLLKWKDLEKKNHQSSWQLNEIVL